MHYKTLVTILAALFASVVVYAQSSGGDFEIAKSTIDNGGGTSSGGDFTLAGTIGQPDATLQAASSGGFRLAGGFWTGVSDVIFEHGFEGD